MKKFFKNEEAITLIALIVTIIVLLILAGITITALSGENGILNKATQSAIQSDIAETKEQIKLEIMGNVDENGNYTNENVIEAVKKITDKEVVVEAQTVESKKGNQVDLSDLWKKELKFFVSSSDIHIETIEVEYNASDTWIDLIEKVIELTGANIHVLDMHPIRFQESGVWEYVLSLNGEAVDGDDPIVNRALYNIISAN